MKFTLSWLADHIDTDAPVEKIADTLTNIGLEVEAIEDKAKALAPFTVAYVVSAEKHPNADKLSICKVLVGAAEPLQIVCGASNVVAGGTYPVALVGAVLPGSVTNPRIGLPRCG